MACLSLISEAVLLGFMKSHFEQCTYMVVVPDKMTNESYIVCVINSVCLYCNFRVVSVNLLHPGSHHTTSFIALAPVFLPLFLFFLVLVSLLTMPVSAFPCVTAFHSLGSLCWAQKHSSSLYVQGQDGGSLLSLQASM